MSVSGQITVGWAGRHVRYSEVMSGPVDTFSLGCTTSPGWAAGHDEPVSCHLRRRRRAPEGTGYRE
jgi:hypothetical protein